jgi:NAD(P)-dependent dehydrogenase (short-subunit alcohol dehydrogenase family)
MLKRRTLVAAAVLAISIGYSSYERMSLSAVRARNLAQSLAGKHAVVVGGTSGIGRGVAVRLAEANASVTIVGRDQARADEVLAEMRGKGGSGVHSFAPVDSFLLSNVKAFTDSYLSNHDQLDVLVVSQGMATLQGRTETAEGIDQKMALHYYGRMAYVVGLLPALRKAAAADSAASPRVLTVLTAGMHPPYVHYKEDPEVKHHYSLKNAADACCMYNDCAMDALSRAQGNEGITFIHAAPGMVNSNWGTEMPAPIRWLVRLGQPVFGTSVTAIGEWLSEPLLRPVEAGKRGGFQLVGSRAQPVDKTSLHEEAREPVWAHTLEVLGRTGIKM